MTTGNLIYEGPEFLIYKETLDEFPVPVVIKQIKNKDAAPELLLQLKNEFEQTHELALNGVRKAIRLEQINGAPSLLLEYVEGITLKEAFLLRDRPLTDLLKVAIQIARYTGEIHQHQIIHKDLNSKNILVSNDLSKVTLIDFGISTKFNLKSDYSINPERLEGSLAYMSPEQTGRMNRAIDSRSDLYSLGIIFYELVTGRLPFEASDPIEYIHCHIARKPVPPSQVDKTIPEVLSKLIMKLLEKNAENRYQSGFGIKHDLEIILKQLEATGKAETFQLAQNDYTGRFRISQKLYGREKEFEFLLETFRKSLKGELQTAIVCGYSGVGKSSIIHEMHRPVTEAQGYFLEGKFGQYQRNIPYQAFIQAFTSFVKHFLTKDNYLLIEWQHNLKQTLGENLSLLLSLIPDLGLLLGEEQPRHSTHSFESQSRFNYTIVQFIKLLAGKETPIVLFLDDMQWSDLASLDLLKEILTDASIKYVTIIIAYRDNEVTSDHPLSVTLNEVKEYNLNIRQIRLKGLTVPDVSLLLSDTLNESAQQVQGLAGIVFKKTDGNPFFINEFLKSLSAKDLIWWDAPASKWLWHEEQIKEMSVTENVVHFLTQKIRRFPANTLKILQYASCVGTKFSVQTLAGVMNIPGEEIVSILFQAIKEEYIIPSALMKRDTVEKKEQVLFFTEARFAHDRFLQAVYSMLNEEERNRIHYAIGSWMLKTKEDEADVFELVNHLNEGKSFVSSAQDKKQLCQLNFDAGKKAKKASAYESALHYYQKAASLLATDAWENNFDFAFQLSLSRAEAEYLNLHANEADQLFDGLLVKARNKMEKGLVYERKLSLAVALGKYTEALELAHTALSLFNIRLPKTKAGKILSILKNVILMKWRFRNIQPGDLLNLPEIKNEKEQLVTRIFSLAISPVYFSNDFEAYFATFLSLVNYTIKRGNSIASPHIFVTYGIIENVFFQHYQRSFAIGKVCLELNQRNFSPEVRGQLTSNLAGGIYHWVMPLRETFHEFYTGYKYSLEAGDYNYLAININQHIATQIRSGRNLKLILDEFGGYRTWVEKPNDPKMVWEFNLYTFCMRELMGKIEDAEVAVFEEAFVRENQPIKFNLGYFYTARSKYYLFMNEPVKALKMAEEAIGVLRFLQATPSHADAIFYYSMAGIANYSSFSAFKKRLFKRRLKKNLKQFESWEKLCPQNFSAQRLLMCAGMATIHDDIAAAIDFCQKAVQSARDNQLTQLEAFGNELLGIICLENNLKNDADQYLQKAIVLYARWGAYNKVAQMKKQNPALKDVEVKDTISMTFSGEITIQDSVNINSQNIDLASIMKASTAIAGEVKFDLLLNRMMKILVENAGAQEGYVLLEKDEQILYKPPQNQNGNEVKLIIGIPDEESELLPVSVVQYVYRTKEEVVMEEAYNDVRFSKDVYMQKKKPLSVLCMPILHQGNFTGVLYLENNLAVGVFNQQRLNLLRLLSGQIAVSINNSLLYENLEQKVIDRTEQVVQQKNIIEQEKLVSEKLLLNILPAETAFELKQTGKAQPRRYENVTVMFTDFVEFTKISNITPADELVNDIDFYFREFDEIISGYSIEKIKTIGDSYMCVSGLPVTNNSHAVDMIDAALLIIDFIDRTKAERIQTKKNYFDIRIGINSGPVVAGVVGSKKFAYDIWGDSVNIAARLQQTSEPGRINVSASTYLQAKENFHFTTRGKIAIKNKGEVDMFFVDAKK